MKSQLLPVSSDGFDPEPRINRPMAPRKDHEAPNPLLLSVLVFELWHPLGFDGLDAGRPGGSLGLVFEPEGLDLLPDLPLRRRLRLALGKTHFDGGISSAFSPHQVPDFSGYPHVILLGCLQDAANRSGPARLWFQIHSRFKCEE